MSLPTREIWLDRNAERRTGRPQGMYAEFVLPFATKYSGLPMALYRPEDATFEAVPIPEGVVAIGMRNDHAWHGVGDGMAVQVPVMELGLAIARDGAPEGLHLGIASEVNKVFLVWESRAEKGESPELVDVFATRELAEQHLYRESEEGADILLFEIDEREVRRR